MYVYIYIYVYIDRYVQIYNNTHYIRIHIWLIVHTSRFVRVILARGPCWFSLCRSKFNGWSPKGIRVQCSSMSRRWFANLIAHEALCVLPFGSALRIACVIEGAPRRACIGRLLGDLGRLLGNLGTPRRLRGVGRPWKYSFTAAALCVMPPWITPMGAATVENISIVRSINTLIYHSTYVYRCLYTMYGEHMLYDVTSATREERERERGAPPILQSTREPGPAPLDGRVRHNGWTMISLSLLPLLSLLALLLSWLPLSLLQHMGIAITVYVQCMGNTGLSRAEPGPAPLDERAALDSLEGGLLNLIWYNVRCYSTVQCNAIIYIYIYMLTYHIIWYVHMYMYIYVCMYVCVYIYIYTHTHVHIYIYIYICVPICTYIYVYYLSLSLSLYLSLSLSLSLFLSIYLSSYLSLSLSLFVYIYIYIYI